MTELTVNQVDVAKLNVRPGEILMVQAAGILTGDTVQRIRDAFRRAFEATGGDVPSILVIDESLTVEVVRDEAHAELKRVVTNAVRVAIAAVETSRKDGFRL